MPKFGWLLPELVHLDFFPHLAEEYLKKENTVNMQQVVHAGDMGLTNKTD